MTTKEKQGFGLYFLLAFGLAWLCQVGGCMALLQKQNAVLYQLALVATMLCPLLAVLLVLTNCVKATKGWHPIVFIGISALVGVLLKF